MTIPAPLPVAVFISGGGTTLRNLLEKIAAGRVDAASPAGRFQHPKARGLQYAAEASIPPGRPVLRPRHCPKPIATPCSSPAATRACNWS
jgi:folate-dependent phosphoribosylglycinamide formyltransferase PurN